MPVITVITTDAVSLQPQRLSPPFAPPPPLELVTVSNTVYVPGVLYMCGGGFCKIEPVPSPKFQLQVVAPVDVFVKIIGVCPAQTVVDGATVNAATGELSKQTFRVMVSLQLPLESEIITCIVPLVPLPQVIIAGFPVNEVGVPPVTVQL